MSNMEEIAYNKIADENIQLLEVRSNEETKSKNHLIKVLQNLERDLILKNNCQKEFNIENNTNDENYQRIEIFGNPVCFICKNSYKTDSSIQLFYCSHCNKLICRICLHDHYNSKFSNIENSYSKYISNGRGDIIKKNMPISGSKLFLILFIFTIIFFNMCYLTAIFAMKPILNTLETIIVNCIGEIFTHRIEDPNSLFNFYEIFFDKINVLNFNFDLIMIMNWLGDRLLYSCGFMVTIIIFIGINIVHFILILNFDFLDYNENNKYGFWKFVLLLLCYILIFLGIGGSSLLSQKMFLEAFKKFDAYIEKLKCLNQQLKKEENEEEEERENEEEKEDEKEKDIEEEEEEEKGEEEENKVDEDERPSIRESIIKAKENLKSNIRFKYFYPVTIITICSFFLNFSINLEIIKYKNKKDEKIKNETYAEYNISLLFEDYNNTNISQIIYDKIYDGF